MIGWLARQARTQRYFQIIFWTLCVLVGFFILQRLSAVLAPLFVAGAIAYWLDPAVDWLERRGIKRTPAILLLLLLFLVVIAGMVLIVVPIVVREINQLGDKLPRYLARAQGSALPWFERTFHTTLPQTIGALLNRAGADAQSFASGAMQSVQTVVSGAFKSVYGLARVLINIILIPVFSFYLLRDFDHLVDQARRLIPARTRGYVEGVGRDVDRVLSAWFRGQLVVMLIDGTLYMIGLSILGVPLGVAIGALAGLLAFVPVVGVLTGLGLALLVTFLEFHGWGQVIGVLALFAAVPTIEMTVVVPRVVGGRVGLGPVAVIVALLLGGELLGFLGILLAVPLAAVINVILGRLKAAYEESAFFTRTDEELAIATAAAAVAETAPPKQAGQGGSAP
ncbi:MAG TPA: AI-2E family transporter [Polyangia bacterium]|jgi:predicted PurR-regulated permease PerM